MSPIKTKIRRAVLETKPAPLRHDSRPETSVIAINKTRCIPLRVRDGEVNSIAGIQRRGSTRRHRGRASGIEERSARGEVGGGEELGGGDADGGGVGDEPGGVGEGDAEDSMMAWR